MGTKYLGSSLRMWGTLRWLCRQYQRSGIIPTYVGNTQKHFTLSELAQDHPYVCGEH